MVGYFRLLLASLVVYSHFNFSNFHLFNLSINQGVAAVFAFYILSGFFSALILDRYSGEHRIGSYYLDRLLRIYPLFAAVILIVGIIGLFHASPALGASQQDYRDIWTWFHGFLQPFNGALAFLFNDDFAYGHFFAFTPIFSLALEIRYFVIFPLIDKLKDWALVALSLGCAGYVGYALQWGSADAIETASYRSLFGVLPLFLVGYLLYRGSVRQKGRWMRAEWLGALIGAGLILAIYAFNPRSTHWVGEMAVAFLVTPAVLILALKFRSSKIDALAGYLAYGVFLTHIPVIRLLSLDQASYAHFALALAISTCVSLALHYAVERPITKLRHKMAGPRGLKTIDLAAEPVTQAPTMAASAAPQQMPS